MADALRVEQLDRIGDAARPGRLARVDGASQTQLARLAERAAEIARGEVPLVAAEPDADDVVRAAALRQRDIFVCLRLAEIAHHVEQHERRDAGFPLRVRARVVDRAYGGFEVEIGDELALGRGRHEEFDVTDAVARRGAEVLVGQLREIGRLAQRAHDPQERAQERVEVMAREELGGVVADLDVVAPRDARVALERDGAFEVDMELGLGQSADPLARLAHLLLNDRR